MIEHFYQGIDGNFTFEDVYAHAAAEMGNLRAVEIGVASGRSAAFLAVEMRRNPNTTGAGHRLKPRLGLVDNSHGNLQTTLNNLRPVADLVDLQVLCGNSWDMAAAYEDGSLDFVFIDGEHRYEEVVRDIAAWKPKVREGGILAGHDYVHEEWSGVIPAVTEAFNVVEVWRGSQWRDGKRYPSWLVRL